MKRTIRLGKGLALPAADFLESKLAIIGKSGKGKTGAKKVILEELADARMPFVCFDPVGIDWGLRSSFDGSGPGKKVLVIGGPHGDVRMDRRAGADVARAIVKANVSCILDFSEESKRGYREFARDFSHTLFTINDTSRMVVIGEAPEFIPQRIRPDMADVFEAVEKLVRIGRNKGLGVIIESQRTTSVNKDALSEVDAILCFGLISPNDRKILQEWVVAHESEALLEQFNEGLAHLGNREGWFWAPAAPYGKIFKQVRIRTFTTFHPDRTHLRKHGLLKVRPMTTNVSAIVKALDATMDRLVKTKEDARTVKKLQAETAKLRQQLAKKPATDPKAFKVSVREAVRAALEDAAKHHAKEISALQGQLVKLRVKADDLVRAAKEMGPAFALLVDESRSLARLAGTKTRVFRNPRGKFVEHPSPPKGTRPVLDNPPPTPPDMVRVMKVQDDGTLEEEIPSPTQLKLLQRLRELEEVGIRRVKRVQLAMWGEMSSRSSTFSNHVSRLHVLELVGYDQGSTVHLTDKGRALTEDPDPMDVEAFQERVLQFLGKSGKILRVLLKEYPTTVQRQELADRSEFSATSSTYSNHLSRMRTLGLVDYEGGGVKALPVLFLEEGE